MLLNVVIISLFLSIIEITQQKDYYTIRVVKYNTSIYEKETINVNSQYKIYINKEGAYIKSESITYSRNSQMVLLKNNTLCLAYCFEENTKHFFTIKSVLSSGTMRDVIAKEISDNSSFDICMYQFQDGTLAFIILANYFNFYYYKDNLSNVSISNTIQNIQCAFFLY